MQGIALDDPEGGRRYEKHNAGIDHGAKDQGKNQIEQARHSGNNINVTLGGDHQPKTDQIFVQGKLGVIPARGQQLKEGAQRTGDVNIQAPLPYPVSEMIFRL